ncbi:MAG: hypothetical protein F6K54_33790 [Okeania sp. SIO3B5]|uniref:hypothetical protein n=1 Tax=Okeania sp. SIO3B5 TaxID=2607811 RepID=UPI00140021E3|nr:hypothetical protein [Okeania sp. SIO3B5]NEO57609.1 hypothetical protein [Okeania sp. SIO3B5]
MLKPLSGNYLKFNQQTLIKTVTGSSSQYARGNAVFNIVCHKDGKYVRVDIICFGTCVNDTYDIRSQIDKMMKW